MAVSRKLERIAAAQLEMGKLSSATWSWGGNTIQTLGAGDQFPYLTIDPKVENGVSDDQSIDGCAHSDLPVQISHKANASNLGGLVKYQGLDFLWYWMFGYEDGGSSPQGPVNTSFYTHLFEMDKHERHFAAYRADEDTAGDYNATDRKNRAMTLAWKMASNDYRYKHLMCEGWSFESDAESGDVKFGSKGIGYKEERGDYGSANWTLPTALQGSSLNVLHRHLTVSYKEHGGEYSTIGVKNVKISCDFPLAADFDNESGLYIAEPVLGNPYKYSISMTLTRHSADTWPAYRDAFSTDMAMKFVWATGNYSFGLYVPICKVADAYASMDDVSNIPIEITTGYEAPTEFATELGSHDAIQNGNVFLMTKNENDTNEMRRN